MKPKFESELVHDESGSLFLKVTMDQIVKIKRVPSFKTHEEYKAWVEIEAPKLCAEVVRLKLARDKKKLRKGKHAASKERRVNIKGSNLRAVR